MTQAGEIGGWLVVEIGCGPQGFVGQALKPVNNPPTPTSTSLTNDHLTSWLGDTEQVERQLANYAEFGPGCPHRLADAIRYSLLAGGKRLRPLLVLHAARICGSEHDAMPVACAVEMVHTYSLIHDDLPAMDDDHFRRGKPSCHIAFDEATAILAGDALLTLAFEVMAKEIRPGEMAARCCAELANAVGACNLVGGQCDDLAKLESTTVAQLESINQRKTAALLCVSLRLGAIMGNATPPQLSSITAFGQDLGLAFQIVDDLLDRKGHEVAMGKPRGRDAKRGKQTFPDLIGIDASELRAEQLYKSACRHLSNFGSAAEPLIELARFITHRDH